MSHSSLYVKLREFSQVLAYTLHFSIPSATALNMMHIYPQKIRFHREEGFRDLLRYFLPFSMFKDRRASGVAPVGLSVALLFGYQHAKSMTMLIP
jgi:hypothetical protein